MARLKGPGFEARVVPSDRGKDWEPPHLTVWIKIDLGNGRPEWMAIGRIKGK